MNVKIAFLLILVCLPPLLFAGNQAEMNKIAFSAIKNADVEKVRDLIDQGLDPNFQVGEPNNVMRLAISYGRPNILDDLLDAGGNIDHKIDGRMHFVTYAVNRGSLDVIKRVLKENPDLNKLMYFDQYTAFTGMLRKITARKLNYILKASNADLNFRPKFGYSALYHLYSKGECGNKCLEIALNNCADPFLEIGQGEISFKEHVLRKGDNELLDLIENSKCK